MRRLILRKYGKYEAQFDDHLGRLAFFGENWCMFMRELPNFCRNIASKSA